MKKLLSIALLLAMVISLFAGCGAAESPATEAAPAATEAPKADTPAVTEPAGPVIKDGGTFVYPVDSDIAALNPLFDGRPERYTMLKPLFDPLFIIANGEVRYYLAESFETSEDGLTTTLKLRDGLKWHDGEAITADDLIFNISLCSDPLIGKEITDIAFINGNPVEVSKIDDLTVQFVLPTADAYWITNLGKLQIIAEHIYKDEASVTESLLNETPVGNGPFMFKAWNKGESLELVRYDDYYRGKAHLDTVIFKVIPDVSAREIALQNGELSAMPLSDEVKINKYDADDAYTVFTFDEGRTNYMAFNASAGPMSDIKARQAIAYALNQAEIVTGSYGSEKVAIPANSSFSPSSLFYDASLPMYEHDAAKAQQMIDECGLNGATLKIVYNHLRTNVKEQALIIQQQLKQYGINVEISTYDTNGFYATFLFGTGDAWDLGLNGYDSNGDPGVFRHLLKSPGLKCTPCLNISEKTTNLWVEADQSMDLAKREDLFKQVQASQYDDYVMYPIAYTMYNIVAQNNIHGLDAIKIVPVFEDYLEIYMTE